MGTDPATPSVWPCPRPCGHLLRAPTKTGTCEGETVKESSDRQEMPVARKPERARKVETMTKTARTTKALVRSLLESGAARDAAELIKHDESGRPSLASHVFQVAYTAGTYGRTGGLWADGDGNLYGTTSRETAIALPF